MAAWKPEVVTSTLRVKTLEQFQRVGLCLRSRPFQRTRQKYHPATPDTRKIQYGCEKYGTNQFWPPCWIFWCRTLSDDVAQMSTGMAMCENIYLEFENFQKKNNFEAESNVGQEENSLKGDR
jgi:hypothetical protein